MAYLHSHDIIHRDLKPENICIDCFNFPKISGFEIAIEITNETIYKSDTIKGTPIYIAPETYMNKEYSKASDVYAFALILYQMVTFDKPFKNFQSPKQLKEEICDKSNRPTFKTPINDAYKSLIERCWSDNPKSRPSFDEIVKELKTNKEFITDNINEEE